MVVDINSTRIISPNLEGRFKEGTILEILCREGDPNKLYGIVSEGENRQKINFLDMGAKNPVFSKYWFSPLRLDILNSAEFVNEMCMDKFNELIYDEHKGVSKSLSSEDDKYKRIALRRGDKNFEYLGGLLGNEKGVSHLIATNFELPFDDNLYLISDGLSSCKLLEVKLDNIPLDEIKGLFNINREFGLVPQLVDIKNRRKPFYRFLEVPKIGSDVESADLILLRKDEEYILRETQVLKTNF